MPKELCLPHSLQPILRPGFLGALRSRLNAFAHDGRVHQEIGQQLHNRNPDEVDSLWRDNAIPEAFRKEIAAIIREEKGWPNDLFIPQDSLVYVLTIFWDDLEINNIYQEIEEKYGIRDLDEVLGDIEELTFEAFLGKILAAIPHENT